MADPVIYELKYTNGLFLASLLESAVNKTATSLTLYGRGATEYGQGIQQNLIGLLENFASSSAPKYPVPGQLWYNTTYGVLNVYSGTGWSAILGAPDTDLSTLVAGDIAIINSVGKPQYQTISGDINIAANGTATIVTNSSVSITGDVSGTTTQVGKGSISVATTLANNVVGVANLASDAAEHQINGTMVNVTDGRKFIVMSAPHTMRITGISVYSPDGTIPSFSLDYSAVSADGDQMSTKTYISITSAAVAPDTLAKISGLNTWVAPDQAIALSFSGITTPVSELNYTIVYERI